MNFEKTICCVYNFFSLMGKSTQTYVALTFDVERDWYGKGKYSRTASFKLIRSSLPKLLEVDQSHDVVSTLFVTGEVAVNCSQILGRFLDSGHEIGTHTHPCFHPELFSGRNVNDREKDRLKDYSVNDQKAMIKEDSEYIEEWLDITPISFRSGKLSANSSTLNVLSELGYRFDSSFDAFKMQHDKGNRHDIIFDHKLNLFIVPVSLWVDPPDLAGISGRMFFIKAFLYRKYRERRNKHLLVISMHPMLFSGSQERHLIEQYNWMLNYLMKNNTKFLTISQTELLVT